MKKVIITLLILAVLGAGGYGAYTYFYAGSSTSGTRVSSSSEDAVYVETVSSITGYGSSGSGVIDRYSGEVEAQATLEVKLDSNRTLDECYVEVGDVVTVGQELFSYSTQDEEDQIAQNEIEIERDQMTISANETEIASQEKLMASYTDEEDIAETSLSILRLQNENRSLEYEIQSKQLEIESLQEEIDNSVVTAEMGGIVQKISDTDDSSDYYSSSDSSVYITILAEGDYRVKGTVNELNYWDIYEGMTMIVYSRVDSSLTWTGVISEISTEQEDSDDDYYYYYYSSSSDTSSYTFYVQLDSSEGLLLGQHVYMEEDAGQSEEKDGLWLSSYYIMVEDDGAYVWLANTSNVIEKHAVTLGEYDEALEEYEILDGLEADDYIAWPSEGISEGDPVYYYDIAVVSDGEGDDDWDDDLDDEDYYDAEDDDGSLYYDVEEGVYYSLDGDEAEYLDDDEYYDEDAGEVDYDEEEYLDEEYLDDDDIYYDDEEYDDDVAYYDADEDEYVDDEEAYFDDDAESVDGNVIYYDDED